MHHAALARRRDTAKKCVLQIVTKPHPERFRVGSHRQTVQCGASEFHGRDFLEVSNRRARAAVT